MKSARRILLLALLCLLAYACSPGHFRGNDYHIPDSAPDKVLDWANIPDATPKWEPKARYGNHSPYKVWGKSYKVLPTAAGYSETGIGSWYGKKFSGRPTSSQEPYDPYAMTAAHKSLPLPSYVRVTNLENNKSIIVRVNDRGPFHGDRIIDLSYAAAHKIGYAKQGTARVKVEAITIAPQPAPVAQPAQPATPSANPTAGKNVVYLQVGAFRDLASAQSLQQQLAAVTTVPVLINSPQESTSERFHRVRIGPFQDENSAHKVREAIKETQIADPLLIKR